MFLMKESSRVHCSLLLKPKHRSGFQCGFQCGFQFGFQCRINTSKMLFDKKIRVSAGSFDFLCLGKWCSRPHDGGAAARKCKKKHTALCYSPCFQMCDTLRRITMMLMMLTTNSSNTPKAMAGSMVVSAICGKKVVMTPV